MWAQSYFKGPECITLGVFREYFHLFIEDHMMCANADAVSHVGLQLTIILIIDYLGDYFFD